MNSIRNTTLDDAQAILDIYAPYITETPISFETEVPSLADFKNRMTEVMKKHPWIVIESEGEILGYAYAGTYRIRAAYNWSLEAAIYLRKNAHGKGIGKQLYQALIDELKKRGIKNVLGVIALPNDASVKLHESLGFKKVAHLEQIGFKFNQWWDVGYWQLKI